jgi:hypothetical protein
LRRAVIAQFIFTFTGLLLALILVIIFSLMSFTGLNSIPLTVSSCTHNYYLQKYSNLTPPFLTIFITAIISVII